MKSQGQILHALTTAHEKLFAELDEEIKKFKANTEYSGSDYVCRIIERFVDALYQIPSGRDELRSRATLVETRCGPGSDYETARAQSLPSYRGQPRGVWGSASALYLLRNSNGTPHFSDRIANERRDIERVLNDSTLNLSAAARLAYESWRSACRDVQREAELLEVDGCWYLFYIHEAGEDGPSKRAEGAKAIMQTDTVNIPTKTIMQTNISCFQLNMCVVNLESIRAAVDSLVAWATENVPSHERSLRGVESGSTTPSEASPDATGVTEEGDGGDDGDGQKEEGGEDNVPNTDATTEAGNTPHRSDDGQPKNAIPDSGQTEAQPLWPPNDNWHFRPGEFAFRGKCWSLSGKKWDLLKFLVESRRGVTEDELRDNVWKDSAAGPSGIRSHLSKLRDVLRTALSLGASFDPILNIDTGERRAWKMHDDLRPSA